MYTDMSLEYALQAAQLKPEAEGLCFSLQLPVDNGAAETEKGAVNNSRQI